MQQQRITSVVSAAAFIAAVFAAAAFAQQDPPAGMPEMPTATEQHMWLKKFVGEWEMTAVTHMEGMKDTSTGTEKVTPIGDFWVVAQADAAFMDMTYKSVLTLGYNPESGKYIGTWIDSFTNFMWKYEGTVNEAGTTLSLNTEGAMEPGGEVTKFREVTEFKNDDHRVFTSSMLGPDGEWTKIVTVNYRRKK